MLENSSSFTISTAPEASYHLKQQYNGRVTKLKRQPSQRASKEAHGSSDQGYANSMPDSNFDKAHSQAIIVSSVSMDLEPNSTAKATFVFTIPPGYSNNPVGGGQTHGGAVATFLDNITSTALMASKRCWGQGLSRKLNVTFLRTPKEGERCVVETEVIHLGRRVATIHARMRREADDVLLAMCTQEKLRVDEDGKGYEEYYARLS